MNGRRVPALRGALAAGLAGIGFFFLAAMAQPGWAATTVQPLPAQVLAAAPVRLLPADLTQSVVFTDNVNAGPQRGSFKPQGTLDGAPVFAAHSPRGYSNFYGLSVRWPNATPVKKGDVILGRFYARAIQARQESGEAEGVFFFQRPGSDERAAQTFSVGPEWTLIHMPLVAPWDAAPGQANVQMAYAHLEQTFELADIAFVNVGQRLKLSDLPITRFSYSGREPDAAWRKAALQRIDDIRTAPLVVKVVDAAGMPLPGAEVRAELVQPAFLWGSAVSAEQLVAAGADGDRYRRAVGELFDTTVIENGFKWPRWRQPAYRERALKSLDWLVANGKRVKGHTLVWPAWKFSPKDIADSPEQRARIGELVEAHIRDITAATQGKLIGWDVINEPVHETEYFRQVPREHAANWFKLTQAADPRLQLTVNEYGMLNRSSSPLFIAEFLEFAAMLRREGARVDVLGVQGHVGQTPRPPVAVLSDLDLLAAGGNNIQITEFDFNTPDEELQADYTRDFLIALYSHPATSGFVMWGFWQSAHWKPLAAMYRSDWSEKPNLKPWKELVLGQWKTRVAGSTSAAGEFATRGHHGRYRATATVGGKAARGTFELGKGGAQVVLKIE